MSNENAKLQYESAQQAYPMEALTDSGDKITFDTQASLFSLRSGHAPDIRPDGLLTGGVISVAISGSNNVVDVAALSCHLAGVKTSVGAGADTTIVRATADVASISSITVNSGGAITMVKGTDSADSSFSETRGAAGGPPLIPVGSIEIGQVRTATNVAGVIAANEIFQTANVHQERSAFPLWSTVNNDDTGVAEVVFESALPDIHTANAAKGVYASYSDPIFSDFEFSKDYVPSANSYSSNSDQFYGRTKGTSSTTLNQGSFTVEGDDGITDPWVELEGESLFFKFFQDRTKTAYMLDQGKFGYSQSFSADGDPVYSCSISPKEKAQSRAA